MIDIDVIYFDIDGTLLDANIDIANAVNYTRSRLDLEPKPFDEIVSYIGTGVADLVARGTGFSRGAKFAKAMRVFEKYYIRHTTDYAKLYPGVKNILRHFRNKKKIIVTNRFRRYAVAALRNFGLLKYFVEIVGGDDKFCMKPFGCVIERSLARIKADRRRAIIVGDMDIDVMTGKNAGIKTCFVTHGLGKLKDVKKLNPDFVIDGLAELKKIITLNTKEGSHG